MASKFTGRAGAIKIEDGDEFDPSSGYQYWEVWRGPKAAIIAKRTAFINGGWKIQRQKWSGPVYQLRAVASWIPGQGNGSGTEIPVDRYRITTESAQLDIRTNPALIALAGSARLLSGWIKGAQAIIDGIGRPKTVEDGDLGDAQGGMIIDKNWPTSWSAAQIAVANLISEGVTTWTMKRPSLTRVRSISTGYPRQFTIDSEQKVFSTASLVKAFSIPANVARRLPTDGGPTNPNTAWGWRSTQQDSDIVGGSSRAQEMDSWVFAAWSSLMYTFI